MRWNNQRNKLTGRGKRDTYMQDKGKLTKINETKRLKI